MELQSDVLGMLDLLTVPGFCVKDNQIIKVNDAARGLFLSPGTDVRELLRTGKEEYPHFSGGCLYLTLTCQGNTWGACVTRQQDMDVFLLEQRPSQPELQALALAARELRSPLNSTMMITDQLLQDQACGASDAVSRLNRGLYQLLRIVENMSDADHWFAASCQEVRDIGSLMGEIFDSIQTKAAETGAQVSCSLPEERIYTLCSPEQLERAVLNMLSNALKFTPTDGTISLSLSRQGRTLLLSVQDNGSGIADEVLGSVFTRYLRKPAIEDSRQGIGLGMVMIRNAAASHGGTVLIDRPEGAGTRVTMTLAIRSSDSKLRTPITRPLSGGYDPGLIHLSEVLPPRMYDGTK